MKTSESCKNIIKKFESLHDGDLSMIGLQPKMCPSGVWTEGYGHAMVYNGKQLVGESNKKLAYELHTVNNEQQACELLDRDVAEREAKINRLNLSLTQSQFDAVLDFVFNAGWGNFMGSTLLKKLKSNPSDPSIPNEFKKWNKGTVNGELVVMPGLVKRREAEALMYSQNVYTI